MLENLNVWIEKISVLIEVLAVALIVVTVIYGILRYVSVLLQRKVPVAQAYTRFRHALARTLMLSLELLVAADVVRTVALEPSLHNVGILALLVVIRIILGWSLVVEIEGHWPWQPQPKDQPEASSCSACPPAFSRRYRTDRYECAPGVAAK